HGERDSIRSGQVSRAGAVLEEPVPAPRAGAGPGRRGSVTARAGGLGHPPRLLPLGQPTLTGSFIVTGVWPAAVRFNDRFAGNFFFARLTFFAYARASFSLTLPPFALVQLPLPPAMVTLFCLRFSLMRSFLAV